MVDIAGVRPRNFIAWFLDNHSLDMRRERLVMGGAIRDGEMS